MAGVVWLYTHDAHIVLNQSFIYQPIAATLERGLKTLGFEPRRRIVRQQGGDGAQQDMMRVTRCGDVLVFIGEIEGYADRVPWSALRRRGVWTIFYNTEPRNVAAAAACWQPSADEIWDYALSNIVANGNCGAERLRKGASAIIYRHVPPGFAPPHIGARVATGAQHAPILFGNVRSRRSGCVPAGTIAVRNIWGDAELKTLLERNTLFVNLHKDSAYGTTGHYVIAGANASRTCGQPDMPLEAVRISALLSAGDALIVSERANRVDEGFYAGIVQFVSYEQLRQALSWWMSMPKPTIHAAAARARQRFRERFAPSEILRRANATSQFRARSALCGPGSASLARQE